MRRHLVDRQPMSMMRRLMPKGVGEKVSAWYDMHPRGDAALVVEYRCVYLFRLAGLREILRKLLLILTDQSSASPQPT
jgi:hypothetical protein